jgi:hypothetical protein
MLTEGTFLLLIFTKLKITQSIYFESNIEFIGAHNVSVLLILLLRDKFLLDGRSVLSNGFSPEPSITDGVFGQGDLDLKLARSKCPQVFAQSGLEAGEKCRAAGEDDVAQEVRLHLRFAAVHHVHYQLGKSHLLDSNVRRVE